MSAAWSAPAAGDLRFGAVGTFEDGVRVTKARGEAMQAASDAAKSGMVSVIGLDSDKVSELCAAAAEKTGEPIAIANYLCPGNYACSGSMSAVDAVVEMAKPEFKARMAKQKGKARSGSTFAKLP